MRTENAIKQNFVKLIQYADKVIKLADRAKFLRCESMELKYATEKLALFLRQAARVKHDPYERPVWRIIADTERVLDRTLKFVTRCSANRLRQLFTTLPSRVFKDTVKQLWDSIGNVSWLLSLRTIADDSYDEYHGIPPITIHEPTLGFVWQQIAILCSGSTGRRRVGAANTLLLLAGDNARCRELIIEECGAAPVLLRCVGAGMSMESLELIVNCQFRSFHSTKFDRNISFIEKY